MSLCNRRSFLGKSSLGGVVLGMTPRSYRAVFGNEPPSERVRVGMIGVGNQGGPRNNMKYFLRNIVALCDLDKTYLAEASEFLKKESESHRDDDRRLSTVIG